MTTNFEQLGFIADEPKDKEESSFEGMGFVPERTISERATGAAKGLKFFGFEPTAEQIEPVRRKVGVALKEFAGGLVGTPGDLLQFVSNLTGAQLPENILPTSEKISKGFEKLSGEEYNPQNLGEEIIGRGAGALGSIVGLGGPLKGATALKGLARTGLAALIPASVSALGEKAGVPKSVLAVATLSSALLTNRLTGKSLRSINKGLYKDAERLAKEQTVPAMSLSKSLTALEKTLEKGISTGPKSAIKTSIKEIKAKIKDGEIGVDELTATKRDINERLGEFFKVKGSKTQFKTLGKIVDDGIKTFEKTNPEFKKAFRDANSLFKGINESRVVERFIKDHPLLAGEAGLLLKLISPALSLKAVPIAVGAKSAELLFSLIRNKGLRRAYKDIIKNASKNEVKGTLNSLKRFNKEAKREKPELMEEFVEE